MMGTKSIKAYIPSRSNSPDDIKDFAWFWWTLLIDCVHHMLEHMEGGESANASSVEG
jgi:hypothetical protein